MEPSWLVRQPYWVWIALLLTGLNALLLNEMNPLLPWAESGLVGQWEQLFGALPHPFLLRLPGVVLLYAGLGLGFWLGRRFFGREAMLLLLLVIAGSLVLSNASKWVTGDGLLWVLLLLASLGMLGYLKQPDLSWKLLTWLSWLAALWLQPLSALAGILLVFLIWRFRHPEGRRLDDLWLPVIGPVSFMLLWFLKGGAILGEHFLFSLADLRLAPLHLLGMLPWLGFLVAGLIELVRNFARREELAILTAGLLLGALVSNSLWVQWVFALLVAKQLQRFVVPGYPYGNWIKAIVFSQLVLLMVGGILGMMYGYYQLGGKGFRMGMSLMMGYWIPAFFGAVGLLGRHQRLATLGFMFSGLLLSLAFWTQMSGWLWEKWPG